MKIRFVMVACLLFVIVSAGQAQAKHPVKKTGSRARPSSSGLALSVKNGKAVYMKYCVSCHQLDGGGVQNMNPPLIKTSYVLGSKQRLVSIVLNGLSRQEIDGETYTNVMAPFKALKDEDIANVLTYVRRSFGNRATAVTPSEVGAVRNPK